MTTIREAYRAFTDFSDRQKEVVHSIKTEIREGQAQIADQKKLLKQRIAEKFPTLESFPADFLTEISQEAGTERNFSLLLASMERENAELGQRRQALIDAQGTPDKLAREARSLNSAILETEKSAEAAENAAMEWEFKLFDLRPYLDELKDLHGNLNEDIIREAVEGFRKASFTKVFSPAWWSGHTAVKKYEAGGGDIVADWATYSARKETLYTIRDDIDLKEKRLNSIRRTEESMKELEYAIKTPDQMVVALRERMYDAVFDDKFMDILARRVQDEDIAPLAEPILKIANLHKIDANLNAVLKSAQSTQDKIDRPISKLRRGTSNAGSKRIDIDLRQIEKAIQGQEAFASSYTANTRQARNGIGRYDFKTSDDTLASSRGSDDFLTMNMMNMVLLTSLMDSPQIDNSFINQTWGDVFVPNVDISTPDIGDAFNTAAGFSIPDIQTPDINVSVPDISVPSFDTPSFSSDSFSSSSFDGGSSFGGGFD